MKLQSKYVFLAFVYFVVALFVVFDGNKTITVLMLVGLFALSVYYIVDIKNSILRDKEDSVLSLKYKLNKTEKESEEAYKRFLGLSQTFGSGVFMIDDAGIITFSNKDVENYFGLNLNNKDYNELLFYKPLYQFVNKAFLMEERFNEQIKLDEHIYDLISTPIFEGDMFAGCLVVVHDITKLKTAQKLQKRFTADVSHELRTPLSSIKGFSEIMLRDELMSEEHRKEFIELINKEANRMEVILNDLMSIAKLDRLDYELELEQIDIKDVIEESIHLFEDKVKERGLSLQVNVQSCAFYHDKLRINQLLSNLIRNALNYTDAGGISVSGVINEDMYEIRVSDTGIGISEADQSKIFTRFYRVDKARSRDTGGSGLGLSICKHIVLKHGGSITVESVEKEGSTFVILLPLKR